MFKRNCLQYLKQWAQRDSRKPLVMRGARQVGKTLLVRLLAETCFDDYIELNLEKQKDLGLFHDIVAIPELIRTIELHAQQKIIPGKTLLFIDEIQASPHAITQLRYFYEEMPKLHVIAAGSLLEVTTQRQGFSFPVGRVEFCYLGPVRFDEFLGAMGFEQSVTYLQERTLFDDIPSSIHVTLIKQFQEYLVVGGMPEVVQQYITSPSVLDLERIYESLLTGFMDDVHKYSSPSKAPYLHHVIEHAPRYAGKAITYEKFAGSAYRSREMSEAFNTLEKALILHRSFPSASVTGSIEKNFRRQSKLLFLDVGLVCYKLSTAQALLSNQDIMNAAQGQIAEQVVGQTLLYRSYTQKPELAYWLRDKKGVSAEVDFLIPLADRLIPIEVKSGRCGKLRSLAEFIERSDLRFGVRIYSGPLQVDTVKTRTGKPFQLLSIPFYLLHRLKELLGPVM